MLKVVVLVAALCSACTNLLTVQTTQMRLTLHAQGALATARIDGACSGGPSFSVVADAYDEVEGTFTFRTTARCTASMQLSVYTPDSAAGAPVLTLVGTTTADLRAPVVDLTFACSQWGELALDDAQGCRLSTAAGGSIDLEPNAIVALPIGPYTLACDNLSPATVAIESGARVRVTRTPPSALLATLAIDEALPFTFDPLAPTVSVVVPFATPALHVTAAAADAGAIVTIAGSVTTSATLEPAAFAITVTAADGRATRTYTVDVSQPPPESDNTLAALAAPGLTPAFESGVTNYTVLTSASAITVSAAANAATATFTINGVAAASQSVPLVAGPNPILVEVTAQDGSMRTYTVNAVRNTGSTIDANLTSLALSAGALAPTFNSSVLAYDVWLSSARGSVDITPTLSNVAATMTINAAAHANATAKTVETKGTTTTVTLQVVAFDQSTTKTYTVTLHRGLTTAIATSTPFLGAFNNRALTFNLVRDCATPFSVTVPTFTVADGSITRSLNGAGYSSTTPSTVNTPGYYQSFIHLAAKVGGEVEDFWVHIVCGKPLRRILAARTSGQFITHAITPSAIEAVSAGSTVGIARPFLDYALGPKVVNVGLPLAASYENGSIDNIDTFRVTKTTGAFDAGAGFGLTDSLGGVVFSDSGTSFYVAAGNGIYALPIDSLDHVTGTGATFTNLGFVATGLTYMPTNGPSGIVFAFAGNTIASIAANGQSFGAQSVFTATAGAVASLTPHPSGRWLYAVQPSVDTITQLEVSPINGSLSEVAHATAPAGAGRFAVNTAGNFAYVTSSSAGSVRTYTVGADGALAAVPGDVSGFGAPTELALDRESARLYVGAGSNLYQTTPQGDGRPSAPSGFTASGPALNKIMISDAY